MTQASQTIQRIKPATTDLRTRLGFVMFVRGPLRGHADALEDLWSRLQAGLLRKRFARYRSVSPSWSRLPEISAGTSFAELFGMRGPLVGCWELELAEEGGDGKSRRAGLSMQLGDLAPVRGMERASHIRVLFPDETASATIAALGQWAISNLPLWWGSAGFVFHHTSGTIFTAHKRMAALGKRYWCVQIQDIPALQWDALRGMPSVNWLTLIGDAFAQSKEMSSERLREIAASLETAGVSHREHSHGVAIAAGPKPLMGDINRGEDLDVYVRVARLIQPLLLTEHTSLFGPFAKPDVLGAWLGRFIDPQAWLECDISTD